MSKHKEHPDSRPPLPPSDLPPRPPIDAPRPMPPRPVIQPSSHGNEWWRDGFIALAFGLVILYVLSQMK